MDVRAWDDIIFTMKDLSGGGSTDLSVVFVRRVIQHQSSVWFDAQKARKAAGKSQVMLLLVGLDEGGSRTLL